MKFIVLIYIYHLKFIYFFMKLRKTNKNKIVFLSRQTDGVSLDFRLLKETLESKYDVVILSQKIKKDLKDKIKYNFYMYKQMYHLANANFCVIDSYVIPVSVLKHKKHLKVLQIWHSLAAIKQFGYQSLDKESGHESKMSKVMKMHQNYDYIISGSEAMIPHFSKAFNQSENKFVSYGLPRIDYIIKEEKYLNKKITKKYPILASKTNILYAPTLRTYSLSALEELIDAIDFKKYNLIFKGHPNKKMKTSDKRVLTMDEYSTLELLPIADYVLTDYSGVAMEAAAIDRPLYFYLNDYDQYEEKNGINIDLFNEMPNATFIKAKDILNNIKKSYDYENFNKFKNKYVNVADGTSTKLIVDLIEKEMNK